MALKFSTDLRNKLLGLQASPVVIVNEAVSASNLAYADNGTSPDTITDDGGNFITQGFAPGMKIYTVGSTTGGNDISAVTLTAVVAGVLSFAAGTLAGTEAFAATTVLVACEGGSLKDIFRDGVLNIYSGTQPSDADQAVAGTLLLQITESAGAFVAGAFDNGLEFGDAASGIISKAAAETWQDTGIASGTAGWFRLCANPTDAGAASTSLPRIDGTIGTSGADLNMSSTNIVVGSTYTIDTFVLTMPVYYGA
ncbi:MAG: hypothetical protein MIO92_16455 [Methanosarcinaceae archaeon]|nr:hypothetical protein [Methanosarcinaceae archaeon]